jgi:crotonobetainyl-CoA:carnitine CoA-transferase CaiB-like acyl-CoA transferase
MKSLVLVALLAIASPNLLAFDAPNAQMIKAYNIARATMLTALTPVHKQLLATIAARLATSTTADYTDAAKKLDLALSPTEKHAILSAAHAEHEKMRAIIRGVNTFSMHGTTVLHIGSPPVRGSDTAGFVLIHTAMNLGPMTMNAMIVVR